MSIQTRQQTEGELTEIYLRQYSQFKEISSNLDTHMPRITSMYEGFCIDILTKAPLTKENITFVKVTELIKSAPAKVTSSDKRRRLMIFNLNRVEEMTNLVNSQSLILRKTKLDWNRHLADFTLPEGPMKKNVTWMIETATDWEDFRGVLKRGLEQLRSIKDWIEIERERDRVTDRRERNNSERNQPQWTRQRD